jgi:hypothetical protein
MEIQYIRQCEGKQKKKTAGAAIGTIIGYAPF